MKLASTWARGDMGLMVGLLVGALTLGSATPHLFNALGGVDWRFTLGAASLSAFAAALVINFAALGPNRTAAPKFDRHAIRAAWRVRSLRLANFGYLGHMWELYAMWAWIGVFLQASFALSMPAATASTTAKLVTFATVGIGAIGCIAGGLFADRLGRTTLTMLAMAVSGTCAASVGFLFGGNPWLLSTLCFLWGVSIVADSAQFSASIAELSDRAYVGTMLTLQTAAGFTLTLITIHLMPFFVERFSWRFAFLPLAIGPFLGVWAMAKLRGDPDSVRIAGGRR
jgi:predicted MFS family arabinose efflux permease